MDVYFILENKMDFMDYCLIKPYKGMKNKK